MASEARDSQQAGLQSPPSGKEELILAEVERHAQEQCARILEPQLQATHAMEHEIASLWTLAKDTSKRTTEMHHALTEMLECKLKILEFRGEIDHFGAKLNLRDQKMEEVFEALKMENREIIMMTKKKEEAIQAQHYAVENLRREVGLVSSAQEDCESMFFDSLEAKFRQIGPMRGELEAKISGLEMKHNRLTDEVWSSEAGIAATTSDIRKLKQQLDRLVEAVAEQRSDKDVFARLEKQQKELSEWLRDSRFQVKEIEKVVETSMASVHEAVELGLEVAGRQVAAFMTEARGANEKQWQHNEKQTEFINSTFESFRTSLDDLFKSQAASDSRHEGIIRELREAVDEYDRRRKREKTNLEVDMKDVQDEMRSLFRAVDSAVAACKSLEPVVADLVEACEMQLALDRQDFIDWSAVSLKGYKTMSTGPQPQPEGSLPTSPTATPKRRDLGSPRAGGAPPQVISLSKECLTCSSQREMLLTGFKMACLDYKPSPVNWGRGGVDRKQFFECMEAVLEKARLRVKQEDELVEEAQKAEEKGQQKELKVATRHGSSAAVMTSASLAEYVGVPVRSPKASKPGVLLPMLSPRQ
eukprot:TRINITY_DN78015_c0_g1_i1.p1 TRINITY_DN78015_c0_g1~~TRINITY_DN78015_c0_g1_i1.p1  ORF type:complete len:595 (+),score=169.92 TRINITY_DN78015_c0_g1_i1:26-1786(+)